MRRVRVVVSGRVQGVWFREACRREAAPAKLSGWVRNLDDGRVEAVFQGASDAVDRLVAWCHDGPPSAVVTRVIVEEQLPRPDELGFRVR
jgi:acylphosphatase